MTGGKGRGKQGEGGRERGRREHLIAVDRPDSLESLGRVLALLLVIWRKPSMRKIIRVGLQVLLRVKVAFAEKAEVGSQMMLENLREQT